MSRYSPQFAVPPVSPVVKGFLLASVAAFVLELIAQGLGYPLAPTLGFVPARLPEGWLWQPFTYVFLHAGVFHLVFNLLVVWMVGSELEGLWGRKTFSAFLVVCGLGAALTYGLFSLAGVGASPHSPVVGSSGIVYGLLLAYGILFGDRTMYFFMLFPMPARYFVLILGGIELFSSFSRDSGGVAHLAHLGGMLFGFLFLTAMATWRRRQKAEYREARDAKVRQQRLRKAGHLKLVREDQEEEPKHWN